jgi:hypothetical protein
VIGYDCPYLTQRPVPAVSQGIVNSLIAVIRVTNSSSAQIDDLPDAGDNAEAKVLTFHISAAN